nr:MAG TPA: hypothetical protein [Caudoviricetes sp.]
MLGILDFHNKQIKVYVSLYYNNFIGYSSTVTVSR